nr:MAG TPA: outer capsid protein sigma-1 attachment protein [Caudoviricetes sp.]
MNYTTNYRIPLYEGNDPTSYLTTYNETMELIDTSLHALALKVANGEVNDRQFTAEISAIKGRLDTAENAINTLKTELATTNGKVSENSEDISTLETQLIEQGTSIKNLLARVSALETSFESFKSAQEQKNNAYEDSLSGLSSELSNISKKPDLKNLEFNNRIAENTENIGLLKSSENVTTQFEHKIATKDDNNIIVVQLRTNRKTANIPSEKWMMAQACCIITLEMGRDTTSDVHGSCCPVCLRKNEDRFNQSFRFMDNNNEPHDLRTTITFDDTTQNVSIECTLDEESAEITDANFTLALMLFIPQ